MSEPISLGVSEFVAYLNQTLETAYPFVEIVGEIANFKVSRNRWVYFDIKDETASVRCFGTVYALPGPLEDGMLVKIGGSPRLHPLYNFSFNVQSIMPVGEGSIRRAADLLGRKLELEGLFDESRKRPVSRAPGRVALVTAGSSAAYADFTKIAAARWGGFVIEHHDVLVQGEQAPAQIVAALQRANQASEAADIIVLIRGGGSADDLAAFSDERVVRAVAASRIPTLVAIGHEIDISLAELAADLRASTPSNAAELLFPDKLDEQRRLQAVRRSLDDAVVQPLARQQTALRHVGEQLDNLVRVKFDFARHDVQTAQQLLAAYDPRRPLIQGYALIRKAGVVVSNTGAVRPDDTIVVEFADGGVEATVNHIIKQPTEN